MRDPRHIPLAGDVVISASGMPPFARHARAYAATFGWPIFPLRAGTKMPFPNPPGTPKGQGGFHLASTDAETIAAWCRQWPDANIGLPTGKTSGLVVVDLDLYKPECSQTLAALSAAGCVFPPTVTAGTARGGQHLYYRWSGPLRTAIGRHGIGPGIDVKSDGGYTALPPSRFEAGSYSWLNPPVPGIPPPPVPRWIEQRLARKPSSPTPPLRLPPPAGPDSDRHLARRATLLAAAPEGTRNSLLFRLAAQALDWGHSPSQVRAWLEPAARACGLDQRAIAATLHQAALAKNRRAPGRAKTSRSR